MSALHSGVIYLGIGLFFAGLNATILVDCTEPKWPRAQLALWFLAWPLMCAVYVLALIVMTAMVVAGSGLLALYEVFANEK